jgi:1-acyl-sn-glycerol-3-phosphate acyltransferase
MVKIFNRKRKTLQKPKIENDKSTKKKKKINIPKLRIRGKTIRLLRKDPFGNIMLLKGALVGLVGAATYGRFNLVNNMKIEGVEYLLKLPKRNVLFISNHQTYYADVMALYHIFCSVKWRFKNVNFPLYLLSPRMSTYYIAAEETMKESGIVPKILSYAGAVTVRRSWRYKGSGVKREADTKAPNKIKQALGHGWVVTFPQGTTKAFAPIRKGSAHLIKKLDPIVVPVEIDGFRRAFDKKGVFFKKRGVKLSVKFKKPVRFGKDSTIEEIQEFLERNILNKEDLSNENIGVEDINY